MSFPTRTGWAAALVALAGLALAVPTAAQGPPAGKGGPPAHAGGGNGGGPPSWAGGGPPPHAGGGKAARPSAAPKKAAKQEERMARVGKARKQRAKAQRKPETNPAMTCFGLLDELGEAFAESFGTNENLANAFGMCVSREARHRGDADEPDDEPEPEEETTDCEAPEEDADAALASFVKDAPVDGECDSAGDEETPEESPAEDEEDAAGDGSAAPTCFPRADERERDPRANPFAVCVSR